MMRLVLSPVMLTATPSTKRSSAAPPPMDSPRTRVTVVKIAPMGDPMEIRLRGYELTLRLDDAAQIELEPEVQK